MHHDHLRRLRHQPDGNQVFLDVIIEFRIKGGSDGVMRRADEEGVAVGWCFRGGRSTDRAAGARAILDDHPLPQLRVELGGERAGEGIGAAAGREGNNESNLPGRPGLRMGRRNRREANG